MSAVPGAVAGSIRRSSYSPYMPVSPKSIYKSDEEIERNRLETFKKNQYLKYDLVRHLTMSHIVNEIFNGLYNNKFIEELVNEIFFNEKTRCVGEYIGLDSENASGINTKMFYFLSAVLDELYEEFEKYLLKVSTIKERYEAEYHIYSKAISKLNKGEN